jgi:hypothetical protein
MVGNASCAAVWPAIIAEAIPAEAIPIAAWTEGLRAVERIPAFSPRPGTRHTESRIRNAHATSPFIFAPTR